MALDGWNYVAEMIIAEWHFKLGVARGSLLMA